MRKRYKNLACLIFLLLAGCGDIVSDHYANYEEAKKDRLFERGWLPDILPMSTTNIKTVNDLDLNKSRGSFDIPKNELSGFISRLEQKSENEFVYREWQFEVNVNNGHVKYELN
jgi:hypothetical protein